MLADDVDDVTTVEVSGLAEEGLFVVVVVFGEILELPVVAADGATGEFRLESPAGEGPGGFPHVDFGVSADAHAEKFQQLAAPVFVHRVGVVLEVVQPVNHGRIPGDFEQQLLVVAHTLFAEQGHHAGDFVVVVNLGNAGGEDLVPEKGHLLFQRAFGVDHEVQPFRRTHALDGAGTPRPGLIPDELVAVDSRLAFRIEQLLNGSLVPFGDPFLQLITGSPKAGAAHQVGHQGNVLRCHHFASCKKCSEFGLLSAMLLLLSTI